MNPYRSGPPPKWWAPKMSPWFVRLSRPLRRRMQVKQQQLMKVEVQGIEHVRRAFRAGHGVLITPNHPSHADPFSMYAAADEVACPFHFMATWHVFTSRGAIGQWALQRIGIFSVDREGADLQAYKAAVKIVQESPYPLVIFPEGEIYHCNDRVTPFREGPATIAMSAARRAKRPIVCIPAALKYNYLVDPTLELIQVMGELESRIHWRPKVDLPLHDRIYAFAEAMLALKEIEYLGAVRKGTLPERVAVLTESILSKIEARYDYAPGNSTLPERIKEVRRRILNRLDESEMPRPNAIEIKQIDDDLDDVFFVSQMFSYPGDYVAQLPSVERMAETLDKFEEDVIHPKATIRADRQVTVYFDEPITVEGGKRSKSAAAELTDELESRVQALLNQHQRSVVAD